MRIAKIKNKYMYETNENDNGTHFYLIFYDKKSKRYKAIQLTHLYYKDEKRFRQVKIGQISIEKFKEFEVPSGVRDKCYEHNAKGEKIDINDRQNVEFIYKRNLSQIQKTRIMNFVNKRKT